MSGSSVTTDPFLPGEWERVGRGHELQFFALDADVASWLNEGLPEMFAPYFVLNVRKVKIDKQWKEIVDPIDPDTLGSHLAATDGADFRYWIGASPLSPRIEFILSPQLEFIPNRIGAIASLNGLISLQHGIRRSGRRDGSRIAIVDAIRNPATGGTIRHREYLQVFQTLASVIERDLTYSTLRTFADGSVHEDRRIQRMTSRAADLAREGDVFTARPGHCLE